MDDSTTIRVLVGEGKEKKEFAVPMSLLTEKSAFFRIACNGRWKESKEGTVPLPETTAEIFEAYLHWIHREEVATPERKSRDESDWCSVLWRFYTRLWIAGDTLGDDKLRDAVTSTMQDTCKDIKHLAGPVAITLAWENSMPDCTLRRLLLDTYTHFGMHEHIQEHWDEFPAAFLQELLKSTLNSLMGTEHAKRPHERSVCYYHEHNEQLPKCGIE